MGLTNFILTCEKDNEELRKDINYYKNMTSRLKKEKQELKKQLEEYKNGYFKLSEENDNYAIKFHKYKTQQKEFILYLRHLSNWYSADGVKQGMVNEILQKYKSIIGVSDENN